MRVNKSDALTDAVIREYAERLGVRLEEEHRTAFADEFAEQDALLSRLETFTVGEPPERAYHWTTDDEDPLGGFITQCDITTVSDGPLADLNVAIKDNIAVAGVPMTCGSPILDSFLPRTDATVVTRLLSAGTSVVGKANMDEFAFGGDESTMRYRLARNPNDPAYQPGGSSAGSGVLVGNGDVDAALGSDTGGSVRFPAAWCGVVGIKPTKGLVSHDGFVQFSKTLDNIGPLARTTAVGARVLEAIAGEDPADERTHGVSTGAYTSAVHHGQDADLSDITIGVVEELMGKSPDIDERTRAATDHLADCGATVESVSIPSYEYVVPAWLGIALTELGAYMRARGQNHWTDSTDRPAFVAALDAGLRERVDELGMTIVSSLCYAERLLETFGNEYYVLANHARRELTADVDSLFDDVDVLASTGVPMLPPKWGDGMDDVLEAMSNTALFNITGHPAMTLPSGAVGGLPTSLQLAAPHFDEETMLRVASVWETVGTEG